MVDWLVYYPTHHALVCRVHGFAVASLSSHLARQHPDIACKARNAIVAEYAKLDLSGPADEDLRHGPSDPIAAIEGLAVRAGLACREYERCGFLSTNRKMLKVHCKEAHGWRVSKADPAHWTEVKLQTFFTVPGDAIRYFCVTAPGRGGSDDENGSTRSLATIRGTGTPRGGRDTDRELVADITAQWAAQKSQQDELLRILADGAPKHELTTWLRRTEWTVHFTGKDLRQIHACGRMPGRDDDELRAVAAATERLFFSRCVDGLRTMPLMARLHLASPHRHNPHSRPFGPLQERVSMDRYLIYWTRFVCYCLNVVHLDDEKLFESHGFRFTASQRRRLEDLWVRLRGDRGGNSAGGEEAGGDDRQSDDTIEDRLLELSADFWTQKLGDGPFESPLWHFVGVLGIDGETCQFRPAHHFTYVLAGLVYVGRALLGEWAIPTSRRGAMADLPERLEDVRSDWLCAGTYSPMGYVLSLLLYGKKIARETGSRLMVSWSKDPELMFFNGKPIHMNHIRTMVAEMTSDAEDLLWKTLLFKEGDDVRFVVPLAGIEDDLTQTVRGQSFIHSNGLAGKEGEMLSDLVCGQRRKEFLDKHGDWKWGGVRQYLKQVKKFEEMLLLLAHFTGGQPARGTEITGLRLVNGINRDRSVFVIDGEVVLVTQYHKSQAHFDAPKVIPRFLPPRVGQLMAMYMIYVRPLLDRWEADRWSLHGKLKPPSDFIWHNEDGPWDTPQMTAAVSRLSQHYMGRRITLQDWRHIAIAISKKHARQRGAAVPDFEDDEEHDESENYEVPDDLAACHTGQTAANYGVTIDILKRLTAESLEVFGQVSHRWHKFLQVDEASLKGSRAPAAPATKRTQAGAGIAEPQRPTRPKVLQLKKEEGGLGGGKDCILRALRTVLRNDDAQFRSPQQELAVRAAAAKDTPLVAVLPTGGGKSLVFMVPAMLTGAGVTIVVAPYAELKRQLVTRCLDAGLECKHWPEARESWPRVVIVSAEAASSDDFLQWAADLRVRDRLDRVVIDECHLMFTAANEYRRKLRALVLLRNLGCAFVFLTGTLPPLCQREFEEAMQLQNPLYIRASSHRTNVEYLVQRVGNGRGVTEVIRRAKARLGLTTKGGGGKGIVYCATHAKCQMLALQLKCHYYHGTPDDADAHFLAQREEGFQAWLRGESPYIVATSALGTGIDVPGITHVIHFDAPYSIIDYAQEAGRAGRAGERVEAVIVVEEKDWPTEDPKREAALELKTREVNALVRTSGCRRSVLGRCLDNDLRDCDRIDAVPCDNCQRDKLRWKSELSSQGLIMSEAYGKKGSRGMQRLQSALETVEELQSMACVICWMFKGSGAANHKWGVCNELDDGLSFVSCMEIQRGVDYRRDPQAKFLSCFFCHVSQELCTEGFKTQGTSCRWKHIVIPVAYATRTDDELWDMVQELAGRDFRNGKDYVEWLGRKHGKLVCGQEMTNAMAVFNLAVEWREGRKIQ